MNMGEVFTLNRNLRFICMGIETPHLYLRVGSFEGTLSNNEITRYTYILTPQESSEMLFDWVEYWTK